MTRQSRATLVGGILATCLAALLFSGLRVEVAVSRARAGDSRRATSTCAFAFEVSVHRVPRAGGGTGSNDVGGAGGEGCGAAGVKVDDQWEIRGR